jgi:hypothetical protein
MITSHPARPSSEADQAAIDVLSAEKTRELGAKSGCTPTRRVQKGAHCMRKLAVCTLTPISFRESRVDMKPENRGNTDCQYSSYRCGVNHSRLAGPVIASGIPTRGTTPGWEWDGLTGTRDPASVTVGGASKRNPNDPHDLSEAWVQVDCMLRARAHVGCEPTGGPGHSCYACRLQLSQG